MAKPSGCRCGGGRPLEVNHIEPCRGAHGTLSCAHHQANLETLCAPCHRRLHASSRGPETVLS
ncbi:MAG: HNH endonuclease [Elusimicrobia bacterium]|nr:HNH endonuclease [Elusimicrobiota bacterium]